MPPATAVVLPSEADLFAMAKFWRLLSPSFKELYAKATGIPAGMIKYTSPGGHFEIYYITSGTDSVPLTDTIGYGPANWRSRQHSPNGVPDYVDEVAFAADSAWSMEIERFGFVKPLVYIDDSHKSSLYKIAITNFNRDDEDYAFTFYQSDSTTGTIGIASYINLRNEWKSVNFNRGRLDYGVHPEKAIYVTICHEFFHAIQYSMVRQVKPTDDINLYLDDFPVTWTEGAAVMMEDLGFDYVNDYWQYAPAFFSNPDSTTFLDSVTDYSEIYKNGLALMYLFQHALDTPGIGFVKTMYDNNYRSPITFYDNLSLTSLHLNRSWPDLLGDFYTASYYTGDRAVGSRFIKDADSLPQWSYDPDEVNATSAVTKGISPFAMNTFSLVNRSVYPDSVQLYFSGESIVPAGTGTNGLWSVRCILKRDDVAAHDSVVGLPMRSLGSATLRIAGWHRFREALFIVTNAGYDRSRRATISFDSLLNLSLVSPFIVFPNPVHLKGGSKCIFQGKALVELWIYSVDGTLVSHAVSGQGPHTSVKENAYGFEWLLSSGSGTTVAPGIYYAIVGYKDETTKGMKKKSQKVFVLP